ncbi:MAG: hypothetical protein ACWA41_07455 [Putridiphycobacter sp.]
MNFRTIFSFTFLFLTFFARAQNNTLVRLTNQKNENKVYFVKSDQKATVYYNKNNSTQTQKGYIVTLNDSTILVNDSIIPINSITKIHAVTHKNRNIAAGIPVLISGVALVGGGIIVFNSAKSSNAVLGQLVQFAIGAGMVVVGSGITIIGIILTPNHPNYYDIEEDYFISVGGKPK